MTHLTDGHSPHPPAASAAGLPPPLAGEGFLLRLQRELSLPETERIADCDTAESPLPRKRRRIGVGAWLMSGLDGDHQ